jgi:hypothetical protein
VIKGAIASASHLVCPYNGDVPKSPFPPSGSFNAIGGHKIPEIQPVPVGAAFAQLVAAAVVRRRSDNREIEAITGGERSVSERGCRLFGFGV